MKLKLLATATIAVAICASLADATTVKSKHKHYVRAPHQAVAPQYGPNDPYAVWVAGTYVGRDPDPRIRDAMIREFYHNLDNH
jgi:hypothetical protein